MPPRHTAVAPASATISPGARRVLDEALQHPGQYTAAELARARGWDVRATQEDAREARAAGLLWPHDYAVPRPGLGPHSYRDLPTEMDRERAVCMSLERGPQTVAAIVAATRIEPERVWAALRELDARGLVWRLGTLVPVEVDIR